MKLKDSHSLCQSDLILQVAAFRATLEEISESSLLVHVVDIRCSYFNRLPFLFFLFLLALSFCLISLLTYLVTYCSHPLAQQQTDAVEKVLQELDVASIPKMVVWNKVTLWLYERSWLFCLRIHVSIKEQSFCLKYFVFCF